MFPGLPQIFNEFCDYLDGRIKWSGKKTDLTKLIFEFFSHHLKQNREDSYFVEEKEYMTIDYTIRHKTPEYSDNMIELALEHEVSQRKPIDILSHEVQHLIDIKAKNKLGIFYPSAGDETELRNKIHEKIEQTRYLSVPWEEYLFIFGFPTTQETRPSILFKALHFTWENQGQYQHLMVKELARRTIKQKENPKEGLTQ